MGWEQPGFWIAVVQIILLNIVLSGDNAVVIAMACRSLRGRQRMWGMVLGSGVAVVLRIVFTAIVAWLMALPWLKLVGAFALLYIAVDLVKPSDDDESSIAAHDSLWRAVMTVAVADIVMSLDNVVAIAAAANNDWLLLIIGLLISIPLIVAGAALIMAVLDRLPVLVWAGAALLGWIAGQMLISDPAIVQRIGAGASHQWEIPAGLIGAALVLVIGFWFSRRHAARTQDAREA
jgi:YjbE family integral membrane protein